MKRILLFATALFLGANTMAQTADFENQLAGQDTSWFGQPTNGQETFASGLFEFENSYDTTYSSWSGWAYSNVTDNTTAGWGNQFGNITGSGESSSQFGVFNQSYTGYDRVRVNNNNQPVNLSGAYFTNTTYAYLSMLNGDFFATQFGDTSNTAGGEDWFLLTIYGINDTLGHTPDSINFYLADYRFADNTQDYIVNQWTWVDLSALGSVHGIEFTLSSSDVGIYGMNTPAYFAMDNLQVDFTGVEETQMADFTVFPNPTTGLLNVTVAKDSKVSLYNINGQLIKTTVSNTNQLNWDLTDLTNGVYFLQVENNGTVSTQKVVKQ